MEKRTAGRPPKGATTADTSVQVRVTQERKDRWKEGAKSRGQSLSQFITSAADDSESQVSQIAKLSERLSKGQHLTG